MAAGNTKFRVENGLDVIGGANVSGMLRVDGDLSIGGNLAFTLTTAGDLLPTTNSFFVGNTKPPGASTFSFVAILFLF